MKKRERIKQATKKIKDFFVKNDEDDEVEEEKEVKLVGFRLLEVVILIAIATVIGILSGSFLTYNYVNNRSSVRHDTSAQINKFEEAYQDVIDNYYEKVNKDELIDAAIDGMLSRLDGYTSYMNEEEKQTFNERMNGKYQGIGIEFITEVGNIHTVTNVFEGTPAAEAGIKIGDVILKVNNIDASTKTGTELASYIKGQNVEKITVVVKRDSTEVNLDVKKSLILLPSVFKQVYEKNGQKVGYINISVFADNTYNQFKDALTSLESQGISSLVIDVRDNSGGYLHAADDILELFLAKGDIMYQMQNKAGVIKYADKTEEKRTYPVAVLINKNSASASEVLTAAFNEIYNAKVVGTNSYGKGTVQQPSDLINGGMIKITTSKWLTPKGNWVDKKGITPTEKVELDINYMNNPTPDNDNQLQKALDILTK